MEKRKNIIGVYFLIAAACFIASIILFFSDWRLAMDLFLVGLVFLLKSETQNLFNQIQTLQKYLKNKL